MIAGFKLSMIDLNFSEIASLKRSGLIMLGQDSNQLEARITSQLECPVCFNIPRELPIPCCPSGHIVCRPCKKRVTDCPTCRQPILANMTNSLAGALIHQVQHRCKFHDQGCDIKMMLKDLVTHEKTCPDRTIKCPFLGCAQIVKLKSFDSHALEGVPYHSVKRGSNLSYKVVENGVIYHPEWTMGCIKTLDELFHVNFEYHKPSKCFVISIWLAKSESVASKYVMDVVIKGDTKKLSKLKQSMSVPPF